MLARPNVLLITVDDLNDWVGCYGGHPQVITPHIDRLAKRGVRFTSAYTPSPVCGPARNAIFTGRQPFHTGMYSNEDAGWHKSNPGTVLLPRAFQKAGYETLGAGKILHRDTSKDLFGRVFYPKQRWSPFASASVGYTAEELPSKKTADPRHVTFLDGVEHVLPLNRMPSDRSPNETKGESFDWGALDVPDSAMGDGQISDWAIANLLRDQGEARPLEARAKPFFMAIGYYRPHMPLYAPKRYFDAYAGLDIQLPAALAGDLEDVSRSARAMALSAVGAGLHSTVTEHGQWREAVKAYLACITFVDAQVGRVLDALDASAHSNNTWVVLLSDHGFHLGEKQKWGKDTGWQRATQVPLLIVPPAAASQTAGTHVGAAFATNVACASPVSLIDLYPTLVDVCGLEPAAYLSMSDSGRDRTRARWRVAACAPHVPGVTTRPPRHQHIRRGEPHHEQHPLALHPVQIGRAHV